MNATTTRWTNEANKLLLGRKIVGVRYMTEAEAEDFGWHSKGIVLTLDNGVHIMPSADDEGNDAGALFSTDENIDIIPVMRG